MQLFNIFVYVLQIPILLQLHAQFSDDGILYLLVS